MLYESRQPVFRVRPDLTHNRMEALNGGSSTGYDRQLLMKSLQIELAHHRGMALLHQEHPGPGLQLLLQELELPLREAEALDVFVLKRVRIRKENFGRRLLNDGAADGRTQR